MRSAKFRKTHIVLNKMTNLAIKEVIKIINEQDDPLVRLIALRKFKNTYGVPRDSIKYSKEFSILGRIYAEKYYDQGMNQKAFKRDKVDLTLIQEAKVNNALRKAILWVYRFWSPVVMAKVLIQGGGFDCMQEHITEYNLIRNMNLKHSLRYRELLKIFFE